MNDRSSCTSFWGTRLLFSVTFTFHYLHHCFQWCHVAIDTLLKVMTANLYSSNHLWLIKNIYLHNKIKSICFSRELLSGNVPPQTVAGRTFVPFSPPLFSSAYLFFLLELQFKEMFQMAWCYEYGEQREEYFTENMKICQHADIIIAAEII